MVAVAVVVTREEEETYEAPGVDRCRRASAARGASRKRRLPWLLKLPVVHASVVIVGERWMKWKRRTDRTAATSRGIQVSNNLFAKKKTTSREGEQLSMFFPVVVGNVVGRVISENYTESLHKSPTRVATRVSTIVLRIVPTR